MTESNTVKNTTDTVYTHGGTYVVEPGQSVDSQAYPSLAEGLARHVAEGSSPTHSTEPGTVDPESSKLSLASAIAESVSNDLLRLGYSHAAATYVYDRLTDALVAEDWQTLQAVGDELCTYGGEGEQVTVDAEYVP